MDSAAALILIREKLADGRLPHNDTLKLLAGRGAGERCDGCEETITADEFVVERVSISPAGQAFQFHSACFDAWDMEREGGDRP